MSKPNQSARQRAKAAFRHACCFLAADTILRREVDRDPDVAIAIQFPGMVVSAFSSELFLKSLLLQENKEPPHTHNLWELYSRLKADTKDLLKAEWAVAVTATASQIEAMEKRHKIKIPRDLEAALADCGDAFQVMRYVYQDPSKAKFYITHLPTALRNVITGLTGWT